jgi:hypothetical protein
MLETKVFPALLLLSVLAPAVALRQLAPGATRPAYNRSDAPNAPKQIHVDENCRILPDPAHPVPGKKQRPFSDSTICHLESVLRSEHIEERVAGNQLLRSLVSIQEHEFVLQNIAQYPVTFVVQQHVPEKWFVDSDPQPIAMEGRTAIFHAQAQPGEIVRLHVGMRHDNPLMPKTASTSP